MSGSFTFNSFDLSSSGDVSLLDKMVVYANGSAVKVVALGYALQSVDIIRVVEINDIGSTSYTSFSVPSTYNEFYDNVLYNGNEVVFVGTCSIPNQCLCFRVMDNLLSFAASDGNYNFHYFGTMGNEVSNRTASTCLTGDEIAVAYVHPSSGGFLLDRIRIFDFSTPTTPSNTYSQEFDISDGKDDPMEMTYLPISKMLAILQPLFKSTDYYPKVLFADIYSQYSYNAPVTFFAQSVYYYSLDTYKKDNIVCVGGEKTYLQRYPVSAPNVCPDNLSLKVAISAALLNTSWSNPCTNIPENPIINNAPLNSRSSYWNPFCQQQ